MNRITLHAALAAFALASFAAIAFAAPPEPVHKLGDHPAVVVQRLQRQAGYDYASKFYPHPAWLRLYASQPDARAAETAAQDRPVDANAQIARR